VQIANNKIRNTTTELYIASSYLSPHPDVDPCVVSGWLASYDARPATLFTASPPWHDDAIGHAALSDVTETRRYGNEAYLVAAGRVGGSLLERDRSAVFSQFEHNVSELFRQSILYIGTSRMSWFKAFHVTFLLAHFSSDSLYRPLPPAGITVRDRRLLFAMQEATENTRPGKWWTKSQGWKIHDQIILHAAM